MWSQTLKSLISMTMIHISHRPFPLYFLVVPEIIGI